MGFPMDFMENRPSRVREAEAGQGGIEHRHLAGKALQAFLDQAAEILGRAHEVQEDRLRPFQVGQNPLPALRVKAASPT